jgi:hypothetical protein
MIDIATSIAYSVFDGTRELMFGAVAREPRVEQALEYLHSIGSSSSHLNYYLRREGFPGIFPKALESNLGFLEELVHGIDTLKSYPFAFIFSPEEQKEFVALKIVDRYRLVNGILVP